MKNMTSFGLKILTVFFLISCNKNSVPDNSISGRWNILNDSAFVGVGSNNHPVNYTGQGGDYFDFKTDGNIYIREAASLDTLSYSLVTATTILIASFGVIANGTPEISYLTNLTAHSVTINAPIVITPGGVFGKKSGLNQVKIHFNFSFYTMLMIDKLILHVETISNQSPYKRRCKLYTG